MMESIMEWGQAPAEWWQFWMPSTGFWGGLVFGFVLQLVAYQVITIFLKWRDR